MSWTTAQLATLFIALQALGGTPGPDPAPFRLGFEAYAAAQYEHAARQFRASAAEQPTAGAFHNLGIAEWQLGHTGEAVLAWERALWISPGERQSRAALRFARAVTQVPAPELAWYEVCSTWLPIPVWAWIATLTFWGAAALAGLPGWLRWRRVESCQALAAAGFALFILTLPALAGIHSRAHLAVVRRPDSPLRLTPTAEAQTLTQLRAGETVRFLQQRGAYAQIRDGNDTTGWVRQEEIGVLSGNPSPPR